MKKVNLFYLLTLIVAFVSCSSGDDSPKTQLSVNVYDLALSSEMHSSNNALTITSNDKWEIVSHVDWLDFSSRRGNAGTANITVSAKSANDSSQDRIGEFDVVSNDKVETIEVRQMTGLVGDCEVVPMNLVVLTDGVAFDFKFGKKVSYYYYGYIEKVVAGSMTDDEIAEHSQENFKRYTPEEDHLGSIDGLYSSTEYYVVAFGYDSKGNRGDMTKILVTTKPIITNRARVTISNVTYNSTEWNWNTTISPYAKKYYMLALSGLYAWYYGEFMCDAEIAWGIKDGIKDGSLTPILNSGSWRLGRETGDEELYIAAWAVGDNEEFSGQLDTFYGSLSDNAVKSKSVAYKKTTTRMSSKKSVREYLKNSIVKKK